MLCSFAKAGQGSGELYDQIIQRVVPACLVKPAGPDQLPQKTVKYSDMIRFLEVFPEVTYIYEHTMTKELYSAFMHKLQGVIRDKKLPTEDLCRVFNILVRISPYSNFDDQGTYHEILGRLRHSLYDIPKDHFARTLANLLELQQPHLATKMSRIILEHPLFPLDLGKEFTQPRDMVDLFWSLTQLHQDDPLPMESYKFLADISAASLDPPTYYKYIQLLSMVQA